MPAPPAGDDLAIGCDGDCIERRRQPGHNGRFLVPQRPDANSRIITRSHQCRTVASKGDAVDGLPVPLEHARLAAAGERPDGCGMIPGCGSEACSIGRYRERNHRGMMTREYPGGLLVCGLPDCDAPVLCA